MTYYVVQEGNNLKDKSHIGNLFLTEHASVVNQVGQEGLSNTASFFFFLEMDIYMKYMLFFIEVWLKVMQRKELLVPYFRLLKMCKDLIQIIFAISFLVVSIMIIIFIIIIVIDIFYYNNYY